MLKVVYLLGHRMWTPQQCFVTLVYGLAYCMDIGAVSLNDPVIPIAKIKIIYSD